MACTNCQKYRAALIDLHDVITRVLDGGPGPTTLREYSTAIGKLIAATATAKGRKLSDVSRAAGFAGDYVARVCRGDLPLSRRAAILIGGVLGMELGEYVADERKAAPAPELPGVTVPVAPGVSVTMGGEPVQHGPDGHEPLTYPVGV